MKKFIRKNLVVILFTSYGLFSITTINIVPFLITLFFRIFRIVPLEVLMMLYVPFLAIALPHLFILDQIEKIGVMGITKDILGIIFWFIIGIILQVLAKNFLKRETK